MTVHFARCILAPLSLPRAATCACPHRAPRAGPQGRPFGLGQGTERILRRYEQHDRLPNCSSLTATQRGSAETLRGEMGSFPFASTVGSISMPSSAAPNPHACVWRTTVSAGWRRTSMPYTSSHTSLHFPLHRTRSHIHSASCSDSARCPDTAARLAWIRGGVAGRRSGPTLSRGERGDRAMAERGPPPRPSC